MNQAGKDVLFKLEIDKLSLARLITSLRDFGMEIRYAMNKACETDNKQFVVGCVVSVEEIKDPENTLIVNCFDNCVQKNPLNLKQRYYEDGRIAVLMNKPYWHGEAMLLDARGDLWETLIGDVSIEDKVKRSRGKMQIDLLDNLQSLFRNKYGNTSCSVLVLYSHIIPCTNPYHECAKLIEKFANNYDGFVIIAYDVTYQDTETEIAIESLTKCENVYFCYTKYFRPYFNEEVYILQRSFQQNLWKPYSNEWAAKKRAFDLFDTLEVFKGAPKFSRMLRKVKCKDRRQDQQSKERPLCNKPRWKSKRNLNYEENHQF